MDVLPPVCVPDESGHCSICGDEGLVGAVLEVLDDGAARVRLESGVRRVALDLLEDVRVGDRIVVHLDFAIARVREEDEVR
jgi:hydrogenase maturation factor